MKSRLLKWHRVATGLVASSVRSAREYKIERDHRAAPHAPRQRTYTSYTRATPADPWVEIDWRSKLGGYEGARWLCEKWKKRS